MQAEKKDARHEWHSVKAGFRGFLEDLGGRKFTAFSRAWIIRLLYNAVMDGGLNVHGPSHLFSPALSPHPARSCEALHPIGEKDGTNLYKAVKNDLLNSIEFLGLSACPTGQIKDPQCVEQAKTNYKKAQVQASADYEIANSTTHNANQGRLDAAAAAYLAALEYCTWAGPAAPGCWCSASFVYAGAVAASHALHYSDKKAASSAFEIQKSANLAIYKIDVEACPCVCK